MTLVSDLIESARDILLGSTREEQDILNGNITNSAPSLVMTNSTAGIQQGAFIEIDLELMYVTSVSGTTVNVIRTQRGSTNAAHTSGAVISVNPRFPRYRILRALNDDLRDLSGLGLFKVTTLEVTYSSAVGGYNITSATQIDEILEVKVDETGTGKIWPVIRPKHWDLRRESNTTDFASGFALVLRTGGYPGNAIRVSYASPYTSLANLTDDVLSVAGLHNEAHDIPPLGAAWRLQSPREVQRNDTVTLSAGQRVPPGAVLNATRGIVGVRESRITTEAGRLRKRFPHRLS